MLMKRVIGRNIEDFFPVAAPARLWTGCRQFINQLSQSVDACCLLFINTNSELTFSQPQQLDASQGVEPQIQFQIHGNIERTDIRLCLTDKLCDNRPNAFLESRMLRSGFPADRRILALRLLPLNLETLELACNRSRKRLI